jgi:hypothetical protein
MPSCSSVLGAEPRYKDAIGIDKKELFKVLVSLDAMYAEHRAAGIPVDTEAEFRSYMVLTKVRSSSLPLFIAA